MKVKSKMKLDLIYNQDCLKTLKKIKDNSIDLIVTSPPYANKRKHTYGGVPVKKYIQWFLPISAELKRVLKPKGSFILNIKEHPLNGERDTYVIELILEMRKQGWLWIEEYIWHKRNSFPGKWPNRFRDAWERCLHFTKQKKFNMYQEDVMIPMGDWAKKRLRNLSEKDKIRYESQVLSGFSKNISNWIKRKKAYPTNVLHFATVCKNVEHSAAFPYELPAWFIKLFTKENDVVLDPFMGSGTTAIAAMTLKRHYIGSEIKTEHYKSSMKKIKHIGRQVRKSERNKPVLIRNTIIKTRQR